MSFPKLDMPIYETELPTTGKTVKFRPFLVKEHKVLMMSQQDDIDGINKVVGDLIKTCTYNSVDINNLSGIDAEYLFMQIRAKSIGEDYGFVINCECGNTIEATANITEIEKTKDPSHTNKIQLTPTVGVEMKYPKFGSMYQVYANQDTETIFNMIVSCVKGVYTPESYTESDDSNHEELIEFLEGLTKEQFDKIENFFVTMPNIVQKVDRACDVCGKVNHVEIKGMDNFFI